jgi:hypothetical protein
MKNDNFNFHLSLDNYIKIKSHKHEMLAQIKEKFPNDLSQGRFAIFLVSEDIDQSKNFLDELSTILGYKIFDSDTTGTSICASGVKNVLVKDMDTEISKLSDFTEKYNCTIIACDYAQ